MSKIIEIWKPRRQTVKKIKNVVNEVVSKRYIPKYLFFKNQERKRFHWIINELGLEILTLRGERIDLKNEIRMRRKQLDIQTEAFGAIRAVTFDSEMTEFERNKRIREILDDANDRVMETFDEY